jgi:hypothetical protein
MSGYSTDRPSYQYNHTNEPTRNQLLDQNHLNPSKSKVNVRQSLNKTADVYPASHHNLINIRNSCIIPHPQLAQSQAKQEQNY